MNSEDSMTKAGRIASVKDGEGKQRVKQVTNILRSH